MRRDELLEALAARIAACSCSHPARVAVDGIDAAGKTTLADELVPYVQAHGRSVIRASIDGFHRPRAERYQRGASSAEGYYQDSFDYPALREALLLPLGPMGSGRYRRAVFDFRTDRPLDAAEETAPVDAVLIMDGVFLLRPELDAFWDYRIWVETPFEVALERAKQRDVALFGSVEAVEARYQTRYIPGQRLYFEMAQPRERADAIVRNENPAHLLLAFRAAM
ncbi:MAG: Uridine kinase, type 2 [Ktedonobacterales bacterium]|nr:MAG: Uridine kinase, type 2 [Ktedonobacterales bacterium]